MTASFPDVARTIDQSNSEFENITKRRAETDCF